MRFFSNLSIKGKIAVFFSIMTGIAIIIITILEISARIAASMIPTEYLTSLIYLFIGIPFLFIAGGILNLERWVRTWGLIISIASFMTGLFYTIAVEGVGVYSYMLLYSIFIELGWWQVMITSIILIGLFARRNSIASFVKN